MRHFVTGSSGFIGKHVIDYLQALGHEVIPVKRQLIHTMIGLDSSEPFVFVHLSAYGNHYNQKDTYELVEANIGDLQRVLRFVKRDNCQKFYNVSTSSIQLPKQTLYSVSKHLGELLVEDCNDSRFVNIRPYSVYGPGEADHRLIPTVIRALHTGERIKLSPHPKHDWIHVEDFVTAMFNGYTEIGTGDSEDNFSVCEILEYISGKTLKYEIVKGIREYDTNHWVCKMGVPHRPLIEGLKQTYEFFTQKNIGNFEKA